MGQTVITATECIYFNTSHIVKTDKYMYLGCTNFNNSTAVQRCGMSFSSLKSMGVDLNSVKITKMTLSFNCKDDKYNKARTYSIVISHDVNYSSGFSATELVNATKNGDSLMIQPEFQLSTINEGTNNIDLNYSEYFSNLKDDKTIFLYFVFLGTDAIQIQNDKGHYLSIWGAVDTTNGGTLPTLTIEWEYLASSFSCNDIVSVGGNGEYTITIQASNIAYNHRVNFYVNGNYATYWTASAGQASVSNEIPLSKYGQYFTGSTTSLPGKIVLITYDGGTEVGQKEKTVTFQLNNTSPLNPTGSITIIQSPATAAETETTTWTCTLIINSSDDPTSTGSKLKNWTLYRKRDGASTNEIIKSGESIEAKITVDNVFCSSVTVAGTYYWQLVITNSFGRTATISTFKLGSNTDLQSSIYVKKKSTQVVEDPIRFVNLGIVRTDSSGNASAEGTYYELSGTVITTSAIKSITAGNSTINFNTTNIMSYDLSKFSAQDSGTTDLTTLVNVSITVTLKSGLTKTQSINLPLPAYLLFFKKGGGALGIGTSINNTEINLLKVGWDTLIQGSGDCSGLLKLSAPHQQKSTVQFLSQSLEKPVWEIGVNTGLGFFIRNSIFQADSQEDIFSMSIDKTAKTSLTQLKCYGDTNTDLSWTINASYGILTFKGETQNGSSSYTLSTNMNAGNLITDGYLKTHDLVIQKDVARILLQGTSAYNFESHILISSTSKGILFRNCLLNGTNGYPDAAGRFYDEYTFPPLTRTDKADTYTIYTTRTIVCSDTEPTEKFIGTIWLQPIS